MQHSFEPALAGERAIQPDQRLTARIHVERQLTKLIGERRRRRTHFPGQLLTDPAWDVLLLLALADSRDHRLSVSAICRSVDAPATTVLRCITNLTAEGLLIRRPDPLDRRRSYIELSRDCCARMRAYCSSLETAGALAA